MKEQLITYETAILAKEKGCDILNLPSITQSLLHRWLRENYKLHISPDFGNNDVDDVWYYTIKSLENESDLFKETWYFDTYEEALEAGLQEGLNLI